MSQLPDDGKNAVPTHSAGDVAHAIARATLSSIPVAGGAAAELFLALVAPPIERRRNEWMAEVWNGLESLRDRADLTDERLAANPSFIDTALQAGQAATRTSQREKHEALRNAVLHSALPGAPDVSVQQSYVRFVDELSEWHLRILRLFLGPEAWFRARDKPWPPVTAGSLGHVLEAAYPVLRKARDHYDQFWRDLFLRGLVNTETLHGTMTSGGLSHKRTTNMGDEFLHFIEDPM